MGGRIAPESVAAFAQITHKMLQAEGTKIAELPIFREANRITQLSG
jgi:hypothetical protein